MPGLMSRWESKKKEKKRKKEKKNKWESWWLLPKQKLVMDQLKKRSLRRKTGLKANQKNRIQHHQHHHQQSQQQQQQQQRQ